MSDKHLPPLPPTSNNDAELAAELWETGNRLRREKLNNAIKLVMEAARGEGILIEHFVELGKHFGSSTARQGKRDTEKFHVIKGGKH